MFTKLYWALMINQHQYLRTDKQMNRRKIFFLTFALLSVFAVLVSCNNKNNNGETDKKFTDRQSAAITTEALADSNTTGTNENDSTNSDTEKVTEEQTTAPLPEEPDEKLFTDSAGIYKFTFIDAADAEAYGKLDKSHDFSDAGIVIKGYTGSSSADIPQTIEGFPVVKIARTAFQNSGIISVSIPESVKEIEDNAFYKCTDLIGVSFNAISCTSAGSAAHPVFEGCTDFMFLSIGEGVTVIPDNLFYGCSDLAVSVYFPDSVKKIGECAFAGCRSLIQLVFGSGVEYIGDNAFDGCTRLREVIFSNDITHNFDTVDHVFKGSIEESYIGATENGFVFYDDGKNNMLLVAYCDKAEVLFLPVLENGKKYDIAEYAFEDCDGIVSVVLPGTVKNVGKNAFPDSLPLVNLFYLGTPENWTDLRIESGNEKLTNTLVAFYSESNTYSEDYLTWYLGSDNLPHLHDYPTSHVYVCDCAELRIRKSPSENAEVTAQAKMGTVLLLIYDNGTWSAIEYNGEICYVMSAYLKTDGGSVTFTEVSKKYTVSGCEKLNLRYFTDASVEDNVYFACKAGTELTVTGISNNGKWARISYDGHTLYCSMSYLSEK